MARGRALLTSADVAADAASRAWGTSCAPPASSGGWSAILRRPAVPLPRAWPRAACQRALAGCSSLHPPPCWTVRSTQDTSCPRRIGEASGRGDEDVAVDAEEVVAALGGQVVGPRARLVLGDALPAGDESGDEADQAGAVGVGVEPGVEDRDRL